MPDPRSHGFTRLVQGYYWMTPVFFVVSWRYGFDVRVPFLDAVPGARGGYYAMSLACGVAVALRPGLTAVVGRVESTLCASLLVITTWAAWFATIESAAANDGAAQNPFTSESV